MTKPEDIKKAILDNIASGTLLEKEMMDAIQNYRGDDEMLLGAKDFLSDHHRKFGLLNETIKSLPPLKTFEKNKWRIVFKAAAVLIVVSSLLLFFYNKTENKTLVIEEGLPVFMGNYPSTYNQFMNDYRQGNYNLAIAEGQSLTQKNHSDTLCFYLGCCYNYTGQFYLAIGSFDKMSDNKQFEEAKDYQLAYALTKIGRRSDANRLLNKILDHKSKYTNAAGLLIKK